MGTLGRIDIHHTLPDGTTYVTTTLSMEAAEQAFNSFVSRFPNHMIKVTAGNRTLRRHPGRLPVAR